MSKFTTSISTTSISELSGDAVIITNTASIKPKSYAFRMSVREAVCLFPELDAVINTIEKFCQRDQVDKNICAFTMPEQFLVARLPSILAPVLGELATDQPEVMVKATLNLLDSYPTATWSARLDSGELYCVSVHLEVLHLALNKWKLKTIAEELYSARLIFIAGEEAVVSTVFFDEVDMLEAQACGMCSQSGHNYYPEELEVAAKEAEMAGSNLPWVNKVWKDDGDRYMLELYPYVYNSE